MRPLRLPLVGTVILMLLAGLSGVVVAQGESDGVLGAVFVERDSGTPPAYHVFGSDGTVVSFSAQWGLGVGVWEPNEDGTVAATVVHNDVDQSVRGEQRGTTTISSRSSYEPGEDALTMTWSVVLVPADGSASSTLDGASTAVRRHMAQMPPEASAETPPDPGWQPVIGPGLHREGRGLVTIASGNEIYAVSHADGTSIEFNPYIGDAVGLWAPVGDMTIGST